MKEKIIGHWLLFIGVLAVIDCLHPLDIGIYHLRPFILPTALIVAGWLEIHGRVPFQSKHISHFSAFVAIDVIIIAFIWSLIK